MNTNDCELAYSRLTRNLYIAKLCAKNPRRATQKKRVTDEAIQFMAQMLFDTFGVNGGGFPVTVERDGQTATVGLKAEFVKWHPTEDEQGG